MHHDRVIEHDALSRLPAAHSHIACSPCGRGQSDLSKLDSRLYRFGQRAARFLSGCKGRLGIPIPAGTSRCLAMSTDPVSIAASDHSTASISAKHPNLRRHHQPSLVPLVEYVPDSCTVRGLVLFGIAQYAWLDRRIGRKECTCVR